MDYTKYIGTVLLLFINSLITSTYGNLDEIAEDLTLNEDVVNSGKF